MSLAPGIQSSIFSMKLYQLRSALVQTVGVFCNQTVEVLHMEVVARAIGILE